MATGCITVGRHSPSLHAETPCCVCISVSGKVFVVALKNLRLVTEIDSGDLLQFRWVVLCPPLPPHTSLHTLPPHTSLHTLPPHTSLHTLPPHFTTHPPSSLHYTPSLLTSLHTLLSHTSLHTLPPHTSLHTLPPHTSLHTLPPQWHLHNQRV